MPHDDYLGRTEVREDRLDPRLLQGLAATLDRETPEVLPALWHWMLFQDWKRPGEIGPDGHPKRGGFLPPVHDLPRRMWAGGRLSFGEVQPRVGDTLRRTSTILRIEEKEGASGRLVFVTVRHLVEGPAGLAIEEEQDIVYRGAEGAAVKPGRGEKLPEGARTAEVMPDSLMLFRYSALTGNGHRIHYDHPYVTREEGYPGLVVHGPLQATFLAHHALDLAPGKRIARFAYRGRRPTFDGRRLTLVGVLAGAEARLETRDEEGATCMQAEAILA